MYAAAAGTSVSKRVEDYLAAIVAGPSSSDVAPVLARLRGTGVLLDLRAASPV
jgi:hypothetical protein